jgi:hypothetical protein
VIVGAVASTGSQVYLEKKREEREADRAKKLVAGELLHLQLVFRGAAASNNWPAFEDAKALLPNSAWEMHRTGLADTIDEDLWDQIVMTYALLEYDRERFAVAAKLGPGHPVSEEEAASLRQTGFHIGRLRRRLTGGGGGWLDEFTEEIKPELEILGDSFMQLLNELSDDDLRNDAKIAELKERATELGGLKRTAGDDGAWLAGFNEELNRRLGGVNPGPP